MTDAKLVGQRGELRATIEITRAATGMVETYDVVGTLDPAQLDAIVAGNAAITVADASATLARSVGPDELVDQDAAVDQDAVTSNVKVDGIVTTRTYSDGTVQRNVWESADAAKEFAASVAELGA